MPGSPEVPRTPGSQGDGPAAPKEPEAVPGPSQRPTPSGPAVEDDFQFVLCEGCRQESPNLKLLTCLHTLCMGCLSENKPVGQCPVCQAPIPQPNGIPDTDNVLFSSLLARLRVYRRIVSGAELLCDNCRSASEYWCPECKEFLCTKCFETHQRYVKRENHEAKRVQDIRVGSPQEFLEGTRRAGSSSCSIPTHLNQSLSIYCKQCRKAVCCICALLDATHSGQHCDVSREAQLRRDELVALGKELEQQRGGFEALHVVLLEEVVQLEAAGQGARELVQRRVEELVSLIRDKEEELLALVEERQNRGRRELEGELRRVEAVLRRMEAGERLVEKMGLYATEQEVMDMQPFIKDALEELRRQQPAAAGGLVLHEDFAECRARLQVLAVCIEGLRGGTPQPVPAVEVAVENNLQEEPPQHNSQDIEPTFTISLADVGVSTVSQATKWPKRCQSRVEKSSQISPKLLKLERDAGEPSSSQWDSRGEPSLSQWDSRGEPSTSVPSHNGRIPPSKASRSRTQDAEDGNIIICISEDSEEDTVMSVTSDFTAC
ncbi:protein PML [Numida meleagris]|uniref:protein PML n=1 Tax=Numida meleagris TaxID=8996 RepID=UPI000B3D7E22|nr:protein PML [Numida meleagris]